MNKLKNPDPEDEDLMEDIEIIKNFEEYLYIYRFKNARETLAEEA